LTVADVDVHRATLFGLWGRAATVALALLLATGWVGLLVGQATSPGAATAWFAVAGSLVVLEAALLYANLDQNRPVTGGQLLETLGSANVVTLVRGTLFAWTGGFAVVAGVTTAPATTLLAWAPAVAYAGGGLLDAVDGTVARTIAHETELGSALDAEFDGLGIFVAASVGVAIGAIPIAYLAVAVARYAYWVASRLRLRRGRPVGPLPSRRSRRFLAGLQMAYCVAALAPVTGIDIATAGALLVGGPYLLGFVRDWHLVTRDPPGDPG
jgi:CDP-diacylglycerol--glycerol-3-phosphate 3-phosphatidyltransferase